MSTPSFTWSRNAKILQRWNNHYCALPPPIVKKDPQTVQFRWYWYFLLLHLLGTLLPPWKLHVLLLLLLVVDIHNAYNDQAQKWPLKIWLNKILLQKVRPGHPLPDEAQCLLSSGSLKPKRQSRESYSRDVKVHVTQKLLNVRVLWLSHLFEVSKLSWEKAFQQNWPSRPGRGPLHEKPIGPANNFSHFPPFLPTLPILLSTMHWPFWEAINLFLAEYNYETWQYASPDSDTTCNPAPISCIKCISGLYL